MNATEKKELLSALKLIRSECKKHKSEVPCYECPLASESRGCCLGDDPRKWVLSDEKTDIWRAFKD
uniref:hypothetical protein n=1 Tax=Eubacterium sp. TaxID=142586 RepID=UPI0040259ABC